MARNQELCVVLLDVGPQMGDLLEPAAKTVSEFVQGKMINKPKHEVQLVFFGTTGTRNMLNQEMEEQGDDTQYKHITEERDMAPPDVEWLRALASVAHGAKDAQADWFTALTVAVDAVARICGPEEEGGRGKGVEKYKRRIILVSNFQGASEPAGEEFTAHIVDKLTEQKCLLEVLSIDTPDDGSDAAATETKNTNSDTLAQVLQQVWHSLRSARDPVELRTAFRLKETLASTYFSGQLQIGTQMKIGVKVVKKVAAEKPPSLGKWSDKPQAADATHAVKRDVEYKLASDPDEVVAPDQRVKAYQYGSQTVPITGDLEKLLAFRTPKGMHLLGFVENDPAAPIVPRHHFMSDVWIVAPDKVDERSQKAMAALMTAMGRNSNQLALVRFVPRDNAPPTLFAGTPLAPAPDRPGCLLLNKIPFMEDLRNYPFQSFDMDEQRHKPSAAQRSAMRDVVNGMDLTRGRPELLTPEATANPYLHRLYDMLAARALDPGAAVPEAGPGAARLAAPQGETLPPGAGAAMAALSDAFSITERAQAGAEGDGAKGQGFLGRGDGGGFDLDADLGSEVETVGTATPVSDFHALLRYGKHDVAFEGMPRVISALINKSIGDRQYGKALEAVQALREGAADNRDKAPAFNRVLGDLAAEFEAHPQHRAWWAKVMEAGVTLLSEEEAPGSGATANDAAAFLHTHTQASQGPLEAPAADGGDDDDFEDMD